MRAAAAAGRDRLRVMKFVPVFGFGGTERQFVNLGLALDPARIDLRFGCLRRWGQFLADVEAQAIPVTEYPCRSFRDPAVVLAQLRLARDLRRHRVRIVHAYNFYGNVFAVPAARMAGARAVASIRDLGLYLSPAQQRLQRWVCRFAHRIVVNARAIERQLVAEGYDGRRIVVIPNGLDARRFRQPARSGRLATTIGLPPDAPLVGVLSRLTRLKGLEDFLQAAALVAAQRPEARFVIVGDGFVPQGRTIVRDTSYRDELLQLASGLGLGNRLVLTGFRPDVAEVLSELTVSVLPSLSEGLSNVLLESMAAAVPVVATTVGGTPEVVRNAQNGLLVPPRDPRALAAAIQYLLDHPRAAARLGDTARRDVADRFSIARLVGSTSALYDDLVRPAADHAVTSYQTRQS